MCGIVGVVDKADLPGETEARMREAMELQKHRGPDDRDIAKFPYAQLGHLRLSIIDLSGGHQPMYTADGRYCVVFNGEVYNFEEVKAELEKNGVRFATHSDTEVLLYAYREWGPASLQKFNGMFAFAILDKEKREVFLARDRLGKKPLYYAMEGSRLAFASELKAIQPLLTKRPELDHAALDCYLANRYVICPLTLMKGIAKLPPGYYGIWKDGALSTARYWDIPTGEEVRMDAEDAKRELYSLLKDATRLRMISDVPLGVFLSGGLDSTIVTHLMHELRGTGIKTFAIASAGGGKWDERHYADLASRFYGTDHHEMVLEQGNFLEAMSEMAWYMDDLVADPASVLLHQISKLARKNVTVILSGEGSDELFAGYNYGDDLTSWDRQSRFNALPGFVAKALGALPSASLKRYAAMHGKSIGEFVAFMKDYYGLTGDNAFRKRFMNPAVAHGFGLSNWQFTGEFHRASRAKDMFNHLLYIDSKVWLPDNLLTKADRMSMATSLELRVPFLDYRLVEFCFRLPMETKMRRKPDGSWETKALLRDAFRGKIPDAIMDRRKQGFPSNFMGILTTPVGKDFMRRSIKASGARHLFDETALMGLIDRVTDQDRKQCQFLFSVVLFTLWHKRFMEG